jgi:hypothetical protein
MRKSCTAYKILEVSSTEITEEDKNPWRGRDSVRRVEQVPSAGRGLGLVPTASVSVGSLALW